MKKFLFLILNTVMIFSLISCATQAPSSNENSLTFDVDGANISFFQNQPLFGSDANYHFSDLIGVISEDTVINSYIFGQRFVECELVGEKVDKLMFAEEEVSVAYQKSEKLDTESDKAVSMYDSYDVYYDEEGTTYHLRSNGDVFYMRKRDSYIDYVEITDEKAKEIGADYIKKVLGERAELYEYYDSENRGLFYRVTHQRKIDGTGNRDYVTVFINSDHEVYSFSAQNLGRFDDVADSFTSTVENKYITHLKEKLAGLGIEGYELADSYLCEYADQLYLCVEMKQGNVTVDGAEKFVDQTYFYISVDSEEK